MNQHILICDPQAAARSVLSGHLQDAGFTVRQTAQLAEMAAVVLGGGIPVDALLIGAPGSDGEAIGVIASLRRRGANLPIVLLTGNIGEDAVVEALDAGADDVVARPARPRELLARLRAQLRAGVLRDDTDLRIGTAVFQPSARTLQLSHAARPIKLTEKECALLLRLYRNDGRPVPRQTLLREVWGYSPDATSHTVETHIYRLRRKIEATPDSPVMLVNEGGGYRLCLMEPAARAQTSEAPPKDWGVPMRRPVLTPVPMYRAG